jgi:thioredoxin-dependent peroxiredoxin
MKTVSPLHVGDKVPTFSLPDETGLIRSFEEFRGRNVVIYFYPKDNSSYCTAQACQLRDAYSIYKEHNIVVIGISFDSPKSHATFKANYALPFILLSDTKKKVAKLFGADKGISGYLVANRKTIIINQKGTIINIIKDVDITTHSDTILKSFGIVHS